MYVKIHTYLYAWSILELFFVRRSKTLGPSGSKEAGFCGLV